MVSKRHSCPHKPPPSSVDHSGTLAPFIDVVRVLFFHFEMFCISPNPSNGCGPIRHSTRKLQVPDHPPYPRNTAWQCRLTLALLLQGFLVGFGGLTCTGWHTPGFSENPHPNLLKPLPWVRVWVFAGTGTGSPGIPQGYP